MASLKISTSEVFTFFDESSGETVNFFWKRIRESGLGFQRKDKLQKIFKQGKIRDDIEFDYVTDIMVAAKQDGTITREQAALLGEMLGAYEGQ